MNIEVSFEYPHTWWNTLIVYKNFYEWFEKNYIQHTITYRNSDPNKRGNPSGPDSPHVMVIRNLDNKKYIIVSYWDRAIELTWDGNGWDSKNMVEIITSAGVHEKIQFTPFSYTCYSKEFEDIAEQKRKSWIEKNNENLLFRGFLYGERKMMQSYFPHFFSDLRKNLHDYFDELNESKISLSLNGAGEICNRDIEILCSGSVLLRPKLKQKFHNDLIPDLHYIAVDLSTNPKEQFELILKKYNDIKDNYDLLSKISKNGLEWYQQNGRMESNVELLKKIINLEKLL